jgi:hypothetical protein
MKIHFCDVAKHEGDELAVTDSVLLIMAPATKATTFAAYLDPSLPIYKIKQAQYEVLMQENTR